MWPNPQETADLVTFTEEILNGKLQFLWSEHGIRHDIGRMRAITGLCSYELEHTG